jgi:hypothetical protein
MGEQRKAIASQVYEYMRAHPNEALFIHAIARDLGRNSGSVSTVLGRYAQMPDINIVRVMGENGPVRGLYMYRTTGDIAEINAVSAYPEKVVNNSQYGSKIKPMYEFVGNTQSGDVIVRDEDDNLWRITPL